MKLEKEDIDKIKNPAIKKQLTMALAQIGEKNNKTNNSKMGNIKTTLMVKGKEAKFDSKLEARYYQELLMKEKAGLISNLDLQPQFELIPKMVWNGKTLRKIIYIGDFQYLENNNIVVVDTKGYRTDVYKLKMRLFIMKYPHIIFKEVCSNNEKSSR